MVEQYGTKTHLIFVYQQEAEATVRETLLSIHRQVRLRFVNVISSQFRKASSRENLTTTTSARPRMHIEPGANEGSNNPEVPCKRQTIGPHKKSTSKHGKLRQTVDCDWSSHSSLSTFLTNLDPYLQAIGEAYASHIYRNLVVNGCTILYVWIM
jgi:hypothetical protein